MGIEFSDREVARFFDVVSGGTSEIFLRLDSEGFILSSSLAVEHLAHHGAEPGSRMLIAPRLADLVTSDHAPTVGSELALAAAGNAERGWIEICLATGAASHRWFALRLVPDPHGGSAARVLAVLRDIHERRTLEDRLFAARMTDPLTGLTNRLAFDSMLEHVCGHRRSGCLALFGIDNLRAFNHRLGYDAGDQVLCGFAEVLRQVMRTGDIISRTGDATFAVLFPDTGHQDAGDLARQAQQLFSGDVPAGRHSLTLSATAGIAEIGTCPSDTLKRAEMALFLGKTGPAARPCMERDRRRFTVMPTRAPAAEAMPQRQAG